MLTMFVSRLWILSRPTSNPASSFAACLLNLAFCHYAKILKDHFVTYRVDFGTDFSNSTFSSSAVFNSLNFLLGGIFNQPPSTIDNKGLKDTADKIHLFFLYANFLFAQKRNCFNSDGTRVSTHIFEESKITAQVRQTNKFVYSLEIFVFEAVQ